MSNPTSSPSWIQVRHRNHFGHSLRHSSSFACWISHLLQVQVAQLVSSEGRVSVRPPRLPEANRDKRGEIRAFWIQMVQVERPSAVRVIEVRRKLTTRSFISSLTVLLCSYRSKVPRGNSNRVSRRNRTSLNVQWLADRSSTTARNPSPVNNSPKLPSRQQFLHNRVRGL